MYILIYPFKNVLVYQYNKFNNLVNSTSGEVSREDAQQFLTEQQRNNCYSPLQIVSYMNNFLLYLNIFFKYL